MYSGQSAEISPYDCRAVIINIFTIDNKLSMCDYKRLWRDLKRIGVARDPTGRRGSGLLGQLARSSG